MEKIINEQSLLEDTIESLCEHGLTKEQAIAHCTEDFMSNVMNEMFEAQSNFIINSLPKPKSDSDIKQFYTFPAENGDATVFYTLEPEDVVVGNFVSSFRFGTGRITRIVSSNFFEVDVFSNSGCCGPNLMQFMHDGRSHWNDTIPSVFKYLKG